MPIPTPQQINAYESAPIQIATAIKDLSESQMIHVPAAGEWSIHEVIIHLPDSETVGYERIRRTLAEDRPALQAYDEQAWANNLAYRTQNRDLAMVLFAALRHSTAALLRSLPAGAWERTAIHAERGEMSLYDVFKMYLDHGNIHLAQLEHIKQSL
jgi:DinB superfamily